jgi:glycosyltransferase involved in cell wall biosynthesis
MTHAAHQRRAEGDLSGFLALAGEAGVRPDVVSLVRSQLDLLEALRHEPPVPGERRPLLGSKADQPGLRVLHIVDSALPDVVTGYSLRTERLVQAQRRLGLEAAVAPQWSPAEPGTRPWDFPSEESYVQAKVASILGRSDMRPDIVHAHSEHRNAEIGRRLADAWGVPLIYEVRGLRHDSWLAHHPGGQATEWYQLERLRERRAWLLADAVIATTELLADRIRGEAPGTAVTVCHNGVDTDVFRYRTWRWEAGDEIRLGYAGRLSAFEGLGGLIEAGALLAGRGRYVVVHIVGDGPDRGPLLAAAAGMSSSRLKVRIEDPLEPARAEAVLSGFTIAAVPRLNTEVTRLVAPMKPLESIALGIPTVVSDLPALREICGDGGAFLCEPGSPEAIAESVDSVLGRVARLEERLEAGSRWVARHRSWDSSAQSALSAYRGYR